MTKAERINLQKVCKISDFILLSHREHYRIASAYTHTSSCYEGEYESEKPAVTRNWTQGSLLEPPVLYYWSTITEQPPATMLLYMYCTGNTECLLHTWQPLIMCHQLTKAFSTSWFLSSRPFWWLSYLSGRALPGVLDLISGNCQFFIFLPLHIITLKMSLLRDFLSI